MRAAAECGGSIPSLCATDSLEAFGSCRLCLVEIDGTARHARQLHHPRRSEHGGPHPDAAPGKTAARGDGTLHLRPPARLPDLRRQQRLRIAGHRRRGWPARRALWV
ncbi:2Fe-2S iron-sulfur cluster-binding protein [Novosphingobium sp.]|uniref:2Fe-2S iron-sulfur cluster-binding protein n=1 Tax=Novosphingobium sp. TaxID=1874826 RepID=UPI0025FCD967|nr:2Fe-2S iron-sulfur cluster-binding protein [Novosphingobium sp.]